MALCVIAILSVLALLIFVVVVGRFNGPSLVVASARPRDAETLAYVATYLIPFLALDLTTLDDVISFVVFMTILGVISVTSHALFVNPVLSLLGYHTYDVTDPDNNVYFLITRRDVVPQQRVRPISVGKYVRFDGWQVRSRKSSTS